MAQAGISCHQFRREHRPDTIEFGENRKLVVNNLLAFESVACEQVLERPIVLPKVGKSLAQREMELPLLVVWKRSDIRPQRLPSPQTEDRRGSTACSRPGSGKVGRFLAEVQWLFGTPDTHPRCAQSPARQGRCSPALMRCPAFCERPPVLRQRLIVAIERLQGAAQIVIRRGVARGDREGALMARKRLRVTIQTLQGQPQIVMRFGIVRPEGERPAILRDRLLLSPKHLQPGAKTVAGMGIVRLRVQRRPVVRTTPDVDRAPVAWRRGRCAPARSPA